MKTLRLSLAIVFGMLIVKGKSQNSMEPWIKNDSIHADVIKQDTSWRARTLNCIGLTANIIGTIILAFSLAAYLRSMRLAIDGHELYIMSRNHPTKPPLAVKGTYVHMNRDRKRAVVLSWLGVALVLIGYLFQIRALFI